MSDIIHTVIYYRNASKEEIAAGSQKKLFITVPFRDVILGVNEFGAAVFKSSIKGPGGLRYYYECVNLAETL